MEPLLRSLHRQLPFGLPDASPSNRSRRESASLFGDTKEGPRFQQLGPGVPSSTSRLVSFIAGSALRTSRHLPFGLVLALVGALATLLTSAQAGIPIDIVLVRNINATASIGSSPELLTNMAGTLYFRANDGPHGLELWRSDGTESGTVMVKDINPNNFEDPSSLEHELVNSNGTLFFSADDGMHGYELWKSDGTEAGTAMVKDINPAGGSSPNLLTSVDGMLFFRATDENHRDELWKSDGTSAGTVMVKEINPTGGSDAYRLTNVNGALYFAARDGTHGTELWKSDGTESGTVMVKDIYDGAMSSDPAYLTNVNGTLYFIANDGAHGSELWKSDGTENGTVMVKDINPAAGSGPGRLTNMNGMLFFGADDGIHGAELWKSDGTSAGTVMVKDFSAMGLSSLYLLPDINGTLFFNAYEGTHGWELWKSDGTESGTVLVKEINAGHTSLAMNGILYFSANDGANGYELWKSDGTESGTVMVKDINPGSLDSYPGFPRGGFIDVNGTLFFTANDGVNGVELWKVTAGSVPVYLPLVMR